MTITYTRAEIIKTIGELENSIAYNRSIYLKTGNEIFRDDINKAHKRRDMLVGLLEDDKETVEL